MDKLIGKRYASEKLVGRFETQFRSVPGARANNREIRLALRMTKATDSCINFHCDGGYASSTSQIPLNPPTEYKGGSLCFFAKDKVTMIARTVGSVVGHSPKVLHGVTRVTEGVRKSLFVLDNTNDLGTGGVHELKPITCDEFMASQSVDPRDIELVVSQVGCSRAKAYKALKANGNELVTAIMSLTG